MGGAIWRNYSQGSTAVLHSKVFSPKAWWNSVRFFPPRFAGLPVFLPPLNSLDLEKPLENNTYEELAPLLNRINKQHRQIDMQLSELPITEPFDSIRLMWSWYSFPSRSIRISLCPLESASCMARLTSGVLASHISRHITEPLNSLDLEKPLENNTYEELAPLK